jgi:hypothetical protein
VRSNFQAFMEQLGKAGIDADFSGTFTTLDGNDIQAL